VSPQNTILCYDGQVKVVDFGIAKAAGAASRTTAGMFKGKLGYVAPEQIAGGDIDRRADVFSVGVMMWEALVGRRLTYGENEAGILHKRTMGVQARVLEARPEADTQLAAICDKAMELDPTNRFSTALDMLAALEARMEALGLRATDGDIGKLVSDAFTEERKGILAIIERQLSLPARSAADASAVAKLPLLASETGPNSIPPPSSLPIASGPWTPVSVSNAPPTNAGTSTSLSGETPRFRTSKRLIAIVVSSVVIVVGSVIAVATLTGGGETASSRSLTSAPTPKPSSSVTMTPIQATIDVVVDVIPTRAKITVDGKSVGKSPFRTTVPKDSSQHELVASADGYTSETRALGFDRDVRLELSLRPLGAGRTSTATTPTPSASASATAGTDLQVTRPKHNIDEKDPY